jgi:predicted N-acyltransferase
MRSAGWTNRVDPAGRPPARPVTLSSRIVGEFASIEAGDWEALDHRDNPFLSHAFLSGLEQSGSIGPGSGWTPHHLALFEDGQLVAFAPSYLKAHSHGEFVFDWAWADAYQRLALPYYPKLLTAIPYSPVSGPRLLTRRSHPAPEALREGLVNTALELVSEYELSSWHCNFVPAEDRPALESRGLLTRQDWQFHWFNEGFADFDDFLERLRSRKRKNIRRERRQVHELGVEFRCLRGSEVGEAELDFLHLCYLRTFRAYGNHPALRRTFFASIATALDDRFVLVIASRGGEPLAMSLFLAGGGVLYGRYWGCMEELPGLHFETAYYQGIEYCIRHGLNAFESGAQGEHKLSRGFLPRQTRSYHYVRDERFRAAISSHLEREWAWMDEYREQLAHHDPYRRDDA